MFAYVLAPRVRTSHVACTSVRTEQSQQTSYPTRRVATASALREGTTPHSLRSSR